MRDGMQVTWRGRIGPATLSKPEAMGSSEVSAQEHYETSPGRKVPSPSEQVKQQALRGAGLKAQAKDRSLRDKVVRGGGVKKQRQIDPRYKILSSRSIPQWGDTKVSLVGDSSDSLPKYGAAKPGLLSGATDWMKKLFASPAGGAVSKAPKAAAALVPKAPIPGVAGSAFQGGQQQWKSFRKGVAAKVKAAPKVPAVKGAPAVKGTPAVPKLQQPMTEGRMRNIVKQTQAAAGGDTLGLAEAQGMKVGPWAKMVSNPMGSMFMQMAAMSAIEPLMYGLGIRSPILGGILPFLAMQSMPGLLESSAGIPRMQKHLSFLAERGKLALPSGGGAAPASMTRAASPRAASFMRGSAKVASVAIPRITTVLG